MDDIQIIFVIGDKEMHPITIKLDELTTDDVRRYSYAGDFLSGLLDIKPSVDRYVIELTGILDRLTSGISINILYEFTKEYDKWLARRRQYALPYGDFFDMNIDHLNEMRTYFYNLSDVTKTQFLTLADRFGQELLLHMYAKLFAESLRNLPRQQIARKLNITPELTPDQAQQVKDAIFNGEEISSSFLEA